MLVIVNQSFLRDLLIVYKRLKPGLITGGFLGLDIKMIVFECNRF